MHIVFKYLIILPYNIVCSPLISIEENEHLVTKWLENGEISPGFAREMCDRLDLNIRTVETIDTAADADVVATTTYAARPIVLK